MKKEAQPILRGKFGNLTVIASHFMKEFRTEREEPVPDFAAPHANTDPSGVDFMETPFGMYGRAKIFSAANGLRCTH